MKRKEEQKYVDKHWAALKRGLKDYLQTGDQEALHEFRVEVKKIRAFLVLQPNPKATKTMTTTLLNVLLGIFLWTERRRGERAMMPLALFGSRPFVGLSLLTFLLYGALGGLLVLLPYLLIVGGGDSPLRAGLALLPFSVVIGTASRLAGRLTARIGPRWPLTFGPIDDRGDVSVPSQEVCTTTSYAATGLTVGQAYYFRIAGTK